MTATGPELRAVLGRVNEATKLLQRSKTVPSEVGELIDSSEPVLGTVVEVDPCHILDVDHRRP